MTVKVWAYTYAYMYDTVHHSLYLHACSTVVGWHMCVLYKHAYVYYIVKSFQTIIFTDLVSIDFSAMWKKDDEQSHHGILPCNCVSHVKLVWHGPTPKVGERDWVGYANLVWMRPLVKCLCWENSQCMVSIHVHNYTDMHNSTRDARRKGGQASYPLATKTMLSLHLASGSIMSKVPFRNITIHLHVRSYSLKLCKQFSAFS